MLHLCEPIAVGLPVPHWGPVTFNVNEIEGVHLILLTKTLQNSVFCKMSGLFLHTGVSLFGNLGHSIAPISNVLGISLFIPASFSVSLIF